MSYWKAATPNIFCDPACDIFKEEKFKIIDAGAAGEMFDPFSAASEQVTVYAFEPRGSTTLHGRGQPTTNVPGGIWSHSTTGVLHLAAEPSTSSIYPPDEDILKNFPAGVGYPARRTKERAHVDLISVDDAIKGGFCEPPNFIKLDVHSAEHEAIVGARNSLGECLGFLVETWHVPIHRGQRLNGEIETLLNEWGFSMFASRQASAWRHEFAGQCNSTDRPQLIGSESLFLKSHAPNHLAAQHVALLELFGFCNFARLKAHEYGAAGVLRNRDWIVEALTRNLQLREKRSNKHRRVWSLARKLISAAAK